MFVLEHKKNIKHYLSSIIIQYQTKKLITSDEKK